MITYAQKQTDDEIAPPAAEEHIAPAPRVSVQAFCESVDTASACP